MAGGEAIKEVKAYPMVGGEGPQSYSRNSQGQRTVIDDAKELINEAVSAKLDLQRLFPNPASKVLRIADFGCAVGPNTFVSVENIIEAVKLKLNGKEKPNPEPEDDIEFHVFFNDHADNDFNTLFRKLPSNRQYFVAGVPGSFHRQVLPSRSLHVGHMSYALHWLSKIPQEVVDWNRKSVYCTGLVEEVANAYAAQFRTDLAAFLGARAQELVPGGLLLIIGTSQPEGTAMSETAKGLTLDIFGSCLFDMAEAGLIDKQKAESFNLPAYFANVGELKKMIEEQGCFSLEFMGTLKNPLNVLPFDGRALALSQRAACEGLIKEHFGDEILEEFFERLAEKMEHHLNNLQQCSNEVQFLFVLGRKDN